MTKAKGITVSSVSNRVWSKSRCKAMTKPDMEILKNPRPSKVIKPKIIEITGRKLEKWKVYYEQQNKKTIRQ